jgi:hypothetical protein
VEIQKTIQVKNAFISSLQELVRVLEPLGEDARLQQDARKAVLRALEQAEAVGVTIDGAFRQLTRQMEAHYHDHGGEKHTALAMLALARPSRGLEAVLRMRGFSCQQVDPSELTERAREEQPALIVQDPFAEGATGWRRLYEWKRVSQTSRIAALLVRQTEDGDHLPLGAADILARPLGRADLPIRVHALFDGIPDPLFVSLYDENESSRSRLEHVLEAVGIEKRVCESADAVRASADDPEVSTLLFPLATEEARLTLDTLDWQRAAPEHHLVLILGPEDHDRAARMVQHLPSRPLNDHAEVIDDVIGRVMTTGEPPPGLDTRSIVPLQTFYHMVERALHAAKRFGRSALLMRVSFDASGGQEVIPSSADWLALAEALARHFRYDDVVTWSERAHILVFLSEASREHVELFHSEVLMPVWREVSDQLGRSLPPVSARFAEVPDKGSDLQSLLTTLHA